ncbi:MAG: type II toxin-antitoxin system VapB family antitoxin [bacterium]
MLNHRTKKEAVNNALLEYIQRMGQKFWIYLVKSIMMQTMIINHKGIKDENNCRYLDMISDPETGRSK